MKSRFPAIPGTLEAGTESFYGGFERWQSWAGTVTLGVAWPMRDQPVAGSSLLYVVRPASAG